MLRLRNLALDESISWFNLCNKARITQFTYDEIPYWRVCYYQRQFSSSMEGRNLTTLLAIVGIFGNRKQNGRLKGQYKQSEMSNPYTAIL